jgi:hypothetical protein
MPALPIYLSGDRADGREQVTTTFHLCLHVLTYVPTRNWADLGRHHSSHNKQLPSLPQTTLGLIQSVPKWSGGETGACLLM